MKKSRWGIYLALKEFGVDTSLGRRGSKRTDKKIDIYLNDEWMKGDIGRSPKQIAELLDVSTKEVNTTLKNRTNSLIALASRIPIDEVLTGDDFVDFNVDPYTMKARFSGIDSEGAKKEISLTEKQMNEILIKMQGGF